MIAVTGATGFVGLSLIKALHREKTAFCSLVRGSSPHLSRVKTFSSSLREVDFSSVDSIYSALRDAETVIHVMGVINATEEMLRRVNVDYTRNVVEAAKRAGVKRFILISSVAAIRRHGYYGQTKFEGEEVVRQSGLTYVILRPAYIYGIEDEHSTALLIRTLKRSPLIPLLGGGSFALQPVYIDDVISLILQTLTTSHVDKAYNIAGPAQIPLKKMLELLAGGLKLKRFFLPIPLKPVQVYMRIHVTLFRNTRLPAKQILELDKHEAFDISLTEKDFDFNPIPFEQGVPKMFPQ